MERSFERLRNVGATEFRIFCDHLATKSFRKGTSIFGSFDDHSSIFFLAKGHVKIGTKRDANFSLKYILSEGNIFGEARIVHEDI